MQISLAIVPAHADGVKAEVISRPPDERAELSKQLNDPGQLPIYPAQKLKQPTKNRSKAKFEIKLLPAASTVPERFEVGYM